MNIHTHTYTYIYTYIVLRLVKILLVKYLAIFHSDACNKLFILT